jgi:hypothetical protein
MFAAEAASGAQVPLTYCSPLCAPVAEKAAVSMPTPSGCTAPSTASSICSCCWAALISFRFGQGALL